MGDNGVMDVPSSSPERSRELADLRRRAYGPTADIAQDAAALARLRELEDSERTLHKPVSVPTEPAVREAASVGSARAEADADRSHTASASAPEIASLTDAHVAAPDVPGRDVLKRDVPASDVPTAAARAVAAPRRLWWQRIPMWAVALGGAVLGVALTLSAVDLAADRPDATLQRAATPPDTPEDWDELLRGWDVDPSTTISFGDFRQIDVWQANSRIGAPCVLLSSRGRPFSVSCASQDLDPVVDFTVQSGMLGILNDQLRDGTLLRFVARDDRIDVWVRPAPAREAQSSDTSRADSAPSLP